jgi:hypothetical protein
MINLEHNGPKISHWKAWLKRYGGVKAIKWNLKVEPFVALMNCSNEKKHAWIGAIKDHMPPWGVVWKERCSCWFVLRFQEGRNVNQP